MRPQGDRRGALMSPRQGQGRRRGEKLSQSPWVLLLIGLRWYASISPHVQPLPFPCGEGEDDWGWVSWAYSCVVIIPFSTSRLASRLVSTVCSAGGVGVQFASSGMV